MKKRKGLSVNGLISKLYGGLNMSWINVILFAVGTAVLTAIFLIVRVFRGTSFEMMGVTFEAWIFFAVIIMANCKSPLESMIKVFVFFLISQPLIYLLQVPFSFLGWQILKYYYNWIIWTLLTLPMAFVGWFITKKNWLSVLIFAPVFAYLGFFAYGFAITCVESFPHMLIASLFCLMQIVLYILAFFPDIKQKIVGILIPIITVVVLIVIIPQVDLADIQTLPGDPSFSEEAVIAIDDESIAEIEFYIYGPESGVVSIHAHAYGTATVTVTDGEETTRYTLEVYKDGQSAGICITPVGQEDSGGE